MELRHLRYFLALAEELSFTRAAERVGIAQPPFSQQIQALEQEVGVRLVDRTPRHVALTEAGSVFADRVRSILSRIGEAVVVTQQVGRGMSGHVCVGFTESGCFHPAVTRTLLEFRQAYPALHVTLQENSSTNLVAMIRDGTVDAAFIRPPFEADEVVAYTPLLHERMVVAVPKRHRLASRKATTLAGLSDEVFVFYHRDVRPGLTDVVIAACERSGFRPRLSQEAPQLTSTLNLVAAGLGIAIVPESLRHLRTNDIVYLRLTGDAPQAALGLASRADVRSAALGNFISVALRIARDHKK
ncbi:LysR family transcriptional regulator [Bradyrhizobium commune]|uniref:LysR family transcriptional regulator n=1 Tax=Bradyrhizobium commune TaxID=83627 RepID=A0A7S9DCC5_9BRAD|nr:LysR family transcriptional regulator [Bradyrhizobium commune]QPF94369.1 LysR family transcriptional regulator [Bradyrhizobium commune]